MNNDLSLHGTYLLLMACDQQTDLRIGRLGKLVTEPGYYLYVGSAFGPGGIRARIRHHRAVATRPHWHIDYLRAAAGLIEAWYIAGDRCEHDWARALAQSGLVQAPLKGFGSSDCNCFTHLFYLQRKPARSSIENLLNCRLSAVDLAE